MTAEQFKNGLAREKYEQSGISSFFSIPSLLGTATFDVRDTSEGRKRANFPKHELKSQTYRDHDESILDYRLHVLEHVSFFHFPRSLRYYFYGYRVWIEHKGRKRAHHCPEMTELSLSLSLAPWRGGNVFAIEYKQDRKEEKAMSISLFLLSLLSPAELLTKE